MPLLFCGGGRQDRGLHPLCRGSRPAPASASKKPCVSILVLQVAQEAGQQPSRLQQQAHGTTRRTALVLFLVKDHNVSLAVAAGDDSPAYLPHAITCMHMHASISHLITATGTLLMVTLATAATLRRHCSVYLPEVCQAFYGQRGYVVAAELNLRKPLPQPQNHCGRADNCRSTPFLFLHMSDVALRKLSTARVLL